MRFKCMNCGAGFEAKRVIRCPKCGERLRVQPIRTR